MLLHYAGEVMRTDRCIKAEDLMAMDMLRNQTEPGLKAEKGDETHLSAIMSTLYPQPTLENGGPI